MTTDDTAIIQASVVAIDGRALAITGAPGRGKSSLALALIDRGAALIGDDGVSLARHGDLIIASPPPNIAGLIEVRGVGIVEYPVSAPAPLALMLDLDSPPERLPDNIPSRILFGVEIPCLPFDPGGIAPAIRAEHALALHGLSCG